MRDLITQASQCLLPDHFRGDLPHRLICDLILVKVLRALRKMPEYLLQQGIQIHVLHRGDWNNLLEWIELPVLFHKGGKILFLNRVNLVHDQNHRPADGFQLSGDVPLTLPGKITCLHQPEDDICLRQRLKCHVIHELAEPVLCAVNTRRIQKDNLAGFGRIDRPDLIAGCLRLSGCDRNLLPDQMVHQRRLSDIRSSDNRHKS